MKLANVKQNRFSQIARLDEQIFHIGDLAKVWQIENRDNLRMTLKRYVDRGLLYRLYRGLYSLKRAEDINPLILGAKAIKGYCYVSGETVLESHGVIFQKINFFSFIGEKTKRFQIVDYKYYCRQLKDSFLYNDSGVIKTGKFNIASLERAVADILYFNPQYHFDNPKAINWDEVKKILLAVYNQYI